jgi:hypothetical protein
VAADTTFDLETLSVLAARVDKRLKWAALLLAAMLAILVIDLQLKRSIARQAIDAAERCARADSVCGRTMSMLGEIRRETAGGRFRGDPDSGSGADPGRDSADVLARDAAMAAGPDGAAGPVPAAAPGRPAGRRKRTPGDGPGTGRDTGT